MKTQILLFAHLVLPVRRVSIRKRWTTPYLDAGCVLRWLVFIHVSLPGLAFASEVRDFELQVVETLGMSIYQQDSLAAEATDVLFSQGIDLSKYPISGWVVERHKKEAVIAFIGDFGGKLEGIFEIRKRKKKKAKFKELSEQERKLSDYQLSAFRARSLALENIDVPCSDRYNVVVLEDLDGVGFLVYALAATTDPDAVLVGGHYRFTVSSDGSDIEAKERLSGSCLVLDKTPDDMPRGATLAALTMTHTVSVRPLETHVFLNLLHDMDFYVGTPDQHIWRIHDGKIQRVR